MNDTFLSDLRQALDNCISDTDSIHWMFCNNPESDFSRDRKISFADYCNFMIQMQSKSLPNEVMDFFGHTNDCPSASAFVQQKYKFRHEGWDYLFHLFVSEGQPQVCYPHEGYRQQWHAFRFVVGSRKYVCLQQTFPKMSSRWKKSAGFTKCAGARRQVSGN